MAGHIDAAADWEWAGESAHVHSVCGWRNLMVVAWLAKPTAAAVRELGTITAQLLSALDAGAKVSYIHLIPISLSLPDSEARGALHEITRRYGQNTACVGVVASGSGFWASAVRGIVTSVKVIAPTSIDLRVHAQSSELLGWFPREHERQTGVAIQGTELLRKVELAAARQRASLPAPISSAAG